MTRPRANPQAPWAMQKATRRVYTREDTWAAEWVAKLVAANHPKQRDSVIDDSLRVTILSSRGAGKSTAALARLLKTMGEKRKAPSLFVAVTREQATEIMWTHLKDVVEKLMIDATFNETKRVCTFSRNGSTLRMCGADDRKEIDKLRGQAFAGVVIDEAASHQAPLLENLILRVISPRLGEHNGWIALTGTPGHELRGMFYDASRPGGPLHRSYADRHLPEYKDWLGWSSHAWTLEDGAPHVPAMERLWAAALREKQRQQWGDTHPIWLREYRARWAADDTENVFRYRPHTEDGAEWNVWNPERVGPYKFAKLPDTHDDWQYAYAFDQGFSDAFAINVFAFSPTDLKKTIYHVYCFERTEFYARRLAELLLGDDLRTDEPGGLFGSTGWPVGVVGDTDDAMLAELANVYGIRAVAANRRREFKFGAVELVNGDLVDGRLKILKGTPLEEQLLQLQWVANEFGDLKENKNQANHSTDCLIYGRKLIAHLFETGQVGEDERKKKRKAARQHEEPDAIPEDAWSDLLSSGSYDEDPW